jgi:excisionase family DNA binding protein
MIKECTMRELDIFPGADLVGTEDTSAPAKPAVLVLTVEAAAERLGIGRSLMYALVMSGDVESVCIGRLRRIPIDALHAYVASLRARSGNRTV